MKFSAFVCVAFVALLVAEVLGDCYMHNPRGSNDRLNEANRNRNNAQRLFDSQNNAAGGYCWGPRMTFYHNSLLQIEWTIQHGCGVDHPNVECEVILQYMCGENVRDGLTTDTISQATMDQKDANGNYVYGMHEPYEYYAECAQRQRNLGLFTADRVARGNLPANGGSATRTRQNNGGTRHGFECPEERDYYPYWHPTPWKDIAIITSTPSRCRWYRSESQNVKGKNYCSDPQYNNEADCRKNGNEWKLSPPWNIPPPDCLAAEYNRDNHLGNVRGYYLMTNSYNWVIPTLSEEEGRNCVLRIRYNISSGDYNGWQHIDQMNAEMIDYRFNDAQSPVRQDPNVQYGNFNYTLAMDTTQFGRTFQDRSHVFTIAPRPAGVPAIGRIFNLNVRGKRGNIVQAYPAVEYDFTPNYLKVGQGDFIHIQWTGCDTNPANNAGEGKAQTDRSNIVMLRNNDQRRNYPIEFAQQSLFPSDIAERLAHIDQPDRYCDNPTDTGCCRTYEQLRQLHGNDANAIANDDWNCYVLNAAPNGPYFDAGLIRMSMTGTWSYMSTRNNNFTNRSQKGTIVVQPLIPWWGLAFVITGAAGFVAAAVVSTVVWYSKAHSEAGVANLNWKI